MKYISTRGAHIEGVSSAYAIKTGLASDGGLFMPYESPSIDLGFIDEISKLSYPEMAAKVLSLFLTDYSYDELLEDAKGAYSEAKFGDAPAPLTHLDENVSILEL